MAKHIHLVVFSIGKELYGVGIDSVHEIVRVPQITEVPDAPRFLKGVINLRGRVIPLIDLRKRLGLQETERTKATRVLITGGGGSSVGLMVDAVTEVRKILPDTIEAPPEMITAIGIEYITGVTKIEDRLVILLDLKSILSLEEIRKAGNAAATLLEAQAA